MLSRPLPQLVPNSEAKSRCCDAVCYQSHPEAKMRRAAAWQRAAALTWHEILEVDHDFIQQVRAHRKQQRTRRAEATIPVIGLCGYTNSGKSTLLNRMSGSESVLAEDALFATLDPTTRRIELASGKQALLTDTVGVL